MPRDENGRPHSALGQGARKVGQDSGHGINTNKIVHTVDNLCTDSAIGADLLAGWARSRRDAPSARLAADALTIAMNAHALQAHLAASLGSERTQ